MTRPDALVYLHVIAASALFGALVAVVVLSAAGEAVARLTFRSAALALAAALATVGIGEAASAREDASGAWLDVGALIGYAGLLLPSAALVMATRRRPRGWVTWLAAAMALAALAATFVMAAKPS